MEGFAAIERQPTRRPQRSQEKPPELNSEFLTQIFRDAKKFDISTQKENGQTPWQERYAGFVNRRLRETFGRQLPEFFQRKDFPQFLENAEYTHNADWPEYFGLILQDYLHGRVHEVHVSEFSDSVEIPKVRQRLDDLYLRIARSGERADPEAVFLADALKEVKRAHLQYQKDQEKDIPWASWYAEKLESKLHEKFGEGRRLTKEVLEKLLDQAEEMHTAEWPLFYAAAVMDEIRGLHALTPEEQKEFLALQKAAAAAGRIEKIPDQTMRRRYIALNLKRARGINERSEEAGTTEKSKAENFSPEELQARERYKEIIKRTVDSWAEQQGIIERHLDKQQLAALVKFLHETPESRAAIYAITDGFGDREKYIQRPAVLVQSAGEGKVDIELYLLGWRCPEEERGGGRIRGGSRGSSGIPCWSRWNLYPRPRSCGGWHSGPRV